MSRICRRSAQMGCPPPAWKAARVLLRPLISIANSPYRRRPPSVLRTAPPPNSLLPWRIRRNRHQIGGLLAVRANRDGFTLVVQRLDEIRVQPRAGFDILPGEQLVLAGRHALEMELAILAYSRVAVVRRLSGALLFARYQRHNRLRRELLGGRVLNRSGHLPPVRAEHDLHRLWRGASHIQAGKQDVRVARVSRLHEEAVRQSRDGDVVKVGAYVIEPETEVVAQLPGIQD